MKRKITKFLHSIRRIPDRKHYVEFITATLSIPVLLTVILVNLSNLQNEKKDSEPTPTQPVREVIIREGGNSGNQTVVQPTNSEVCKREIGPISISYPREGATVTENPVNFIIRYEDKSYCSVVWSYRINNGTWSEFSSNSPTVYNMPNGDITFELRVQSTVTEEQEMITRKFKYTGGAEAVAPSPTFTPIPTGS